MFLTFFYIEKQTSFRRDCDPGQVQHIQVLQLLKNRPHLEGIATSVRKRFKNSIYIEKQTSFRRDCDLQRPDQHIVCVIIEKQTSFRRDCDYCLCRLWCHYCIEKQTSFRRDCDVNLGMYTSTKLY